MTEGAERMVTNYCEECARLAANVSALEKQRDALITAIEGVYAICLEDEPDGIPAILDYNKRYAAAWSLVGVAIAACEEVKP